MLRILENKHWTLQVMFTLVVAILALALLTVNSIRNMLGF